MLLSARYKSKTMWNIINSESGKANNNNRTVRELQLGIKNIRLGLAVEAFNEYFLKLVVELDMEYVNIDLPI